MVLTKVTGEGKGISLLVYIELYGHMYLLSPGTFDSKNPDPYHWRDARDTE